MRDFKNCLEALDEMQSLSNKLESLLEKNLESNGKLSGLIESTEKDFLEIKHSLDEIPVKNHAESAYELGLQLISYESELRNIFEKKQNAIGGELRRRLGHKIDEIESKYLILKRELESVKYVKNLKFI